MSESSLSALTRKVTPAVGATLSRQRGRLGRPFEALIKQAGAAVVNDVVSLEMALEVGAKAGSSAGNQARAADAFQAINALWDRAETLSGRPAERVRLELLARWKRAEAMRVKALSFCDEDTVKAINKLESDAAAAKPAFKAGVAAAAKKADAAAAGTLAELDQMLIQSGTDPVLVKLWDYVGTALGKNSPFIEEMARDAAARAEAVLKILREKGVKLGQAELWGHLSNVRGLLGEGLALADKAVIADRDLAFAAAQATAKRLGPGHDVVWLTQVENGIRYADRGAGPDAMILIRNNATGEAYIHTAYQVKAARKSEAFPQSVNDWYRENGVFKQGGWEFGDGTVTFTLPGQEQEVTLRIAASSAVQRRAAIVNFTGATNEEVRALTDAGFVVDEKRLGMSVDQATHLAVSMQQAAIRDGLTSGRFK
jgi:hypothetical protein